jgi:hypothetical protein
MRFFSWISALRSGRIQKRRTPDGRAHFQEKNRFQHVLKVDCRADKINSRPALDPTPLVHPSMSATARAPTALFPPRADLFPSDGVVGRLESFERRLTVMQTGDSEAYAHAARSGCRLIDSWADLKPVLGDLAAQGKAEAILWLMAHAASVLDIQEGSVQKGWSALWHDLLVGVPAPTGTLERMATPDAQLIQIFVASALAFNLPNPLGDLSPRVAGSVFCACLFPVPPAAAQDILPPALLPRVHAWLHQALPRRAPQDHEPGALDRRLDLAAAATLVRTAGRGAGYLTTMDEVIAFQKRLKAWGRSSWSLTKYAATIETKSISSGYAAWPTPHSSEELVFSCTFSDVLADVAARADTGTRAQLKRWLTRPAAGRPEGISDLVFARASRTGRTNLIRHVFSLLGTEPMSAAREAPTIVHYLLRIQPDVSTVRAFARYWGPAVFTLTDRNGKTPLDYVCGTLTARGPTNIVPAKIAQMEQIVLQATVREKRETAKSGAVSAGTRTRRL